MAEGLKFLEGPAWHPYEKHLRFSDILGNSTLQWSAGAGLCLYRRNSHMANGNTYDRDGRFLSCHHASSRVTRRDGSGNTDRDRLPVYDGDKELNSPNDIVVKRDGSMSTSPIRPSDASPKSASRAQCQLDFNGVYRWNPANDSLTLLTKLRSTDPNGLCFSTDETLLYVNDSPEYKIYVFDVAGGWNDQRMVVSSPRHKGDGPGVPDGMKIDSEGISLLLRARRLACIPRRWQVG